MVDIGKIMSDLVEQFWDGIIINLFGSIITGLFSIATDFIDGLIDFIGGFMFNTSAGFMLVLAIIFMVAIMIKSKR